MSENVKCECGANVKIMISEGSNPGCKEREDVYCPQCHILLHSGVYNDARVYAELIPPVIQDVLKDSPNQR